MNVIGYLRVSTDNQCKEDKFGLDVQRQQIEAYCAKNDMQISRWVTDAGESGAKERPGFDEIVYGEVSNPPVEAVVVAKTDRVARDINVYYYYKMLLRKKEIDLVSVSEDFGQMGAFAPFLEAFTLCVAQMERENINKRTSAGRKIKAEGGGYSGGRPPYGYKVIDHKLIVDPAEAQVVREIFELFDGGMSQVGVAEEMNRRGYVPRHSSAFRQSGIRAIIENRKLYQGWYKYGEADWRKGQHEAILPEEEISEEEE